MALRNTPVRDELVLSLDDIFPILKSADGIPVVKHTKRGQSDQRRLRLDTDDSTLEVFRQNTASYFNRKMSTRTYNLRTLEEVGPATSVPGGQGGKAAVPGRTLVFVFRNRNLFVTVETRDLCAALVALFRPAGTGPPSHASHAALPNGSGGALGSGAITAHVSEHGDSVFAYSAPAALAAKNTYASPLSPSSDGPSVWGGGRVGTTAPRRVSETENAAPTRIPGRQPRKTGGGAKQLGGLGGDEGGAVKAGGASGRSNGRLRGSGGRGRAGAQEFRGRVSRRGEPRLIRSASDAVGAELRDVERPLTSSSDEDGGQAMGFSTMPAKASSERSQHRSPKSTSESPDAMMRSRMVGFGSADVVQPKKAGRSSSIAGRTSSIIPLWARFTDSGEKRTPTVPAAPATAVPRFKITGLAVEDNVGVEEDVEITPVEGAGLSGKLDRGRRDAAGDSLAVRAEDRLNRESLRRPASAPASVLAPKATESSRILQDTPSNPARVKPRATNSPPVRHGRISPPLARDRANIGDAAMPQNDVEPELAFLRRQEPPPSLAAAASVASRAQKESIAVDEGSMAEKRKIPPMTRPVVADPPKQIQQVKKADPLYGAAVPQYPMGTIFRDSSYDSSLSPPPTSVRGPELAEVVALTTNGAHVTGAAEPGGGRLMQRYTKSSSLGSFEVDDFHPCQAERPANLSRSSISFSEEDVAIGGWRSANGPAHTAAPSQAMRDGRSAKRTGVGVQERMTNGYRDGEEAFIATPFLGRTVEIDFTSHTSRSLPFLEERNPSVVEGMTGGAGTGAGAGADKGGRASGRMIFERHQSFSTSRTDSSSPPMLNHAISKLTIQTALSPDEYTAPSEAGTAIRCDSSSLPFAVTPAAAAAGAARAAFNNSRGSRGSRGSYDTRGSGEFTSPGSPPGGALGEIRASAFHPPSGARKIPMISNLHLGGAASFDEDPRAPSGFEELWAVLEPAWDINSSFGASCTPKAMLLSSIYEKLRSFQAAVANVCVRACGPVLGEVCRKCGRAWAALISTPVQDILECLDLVRKMEASIDLIIDVVERYEASAVVRRFTLPLIGMATAWEEILVSGEAGDLQEPCLRIEEAIAQLPDKKREGRRSSGSISRPRRRASTSIELRLPACPSYWAKGQFDLLTPNRLADVLTLLHEPVRFAALAELVTRASDVGPANREYSAAWNCVRRMEGPALGRELRRALSATLVAAGELLPLPRVPPPPPAYVSREKLTEQIEATILHPFLPLGIAGIGGASGSGKTVLAAAVVRDATVRCRFGDRVFWLHAGKGANNRLVSILQALADAVYAWLIDSQHMAARRRRGSGVGDGGGDAGVLAGPDLREPVRFRDQDQAVNYVADLCRCPLLAGLRCLVVLDDVHEREVVDALWKSGCQLLVTSPVNGLLQAVGAEATMAHPLGLEVAQQVAVRAAGEESLCEDANRLVKLCRGCPLALGMLGAIVQAILFGGSDAGEYLKPGLVTPRATGADAAGSPGGERGGDGEAASSWSFSVLAAPVGAWVEQVVVGTSSSPPASRQRSGATVPPSKEQRRPATVLEEEIYGASSSASEGAAAATSLLAASARRLDPEATAWANLARRVDAALSTLQQSRPSLHGMLAEAGPARDMPVRELVAVLTELALQEADRILGGGGWAVECYLSFALLPEGIPLPPPALEEFWHGGDNQGSVEGAGGNAGHANGRGGEFAFAEAQHSWSPSAVEVFEALRMLCRAGGGEGADGVIPHGLQRTVVLYMAQNHPDLMQKVARRRAQMLSRISSLVGTFDDDCWGLRGAGGVEAGIGAGIAVTRKNGGDVKVLHVIPSGLLGSRRPGPPSHGYGGFSRYDYLVASWKALPAPYALESAAACYVSSVRSAFQTAQNSVEGAGAGAVDIANAVGRGGWAAARALASAADLQALAGRRLEAIPAYGEACDLLRAEAETVRTAKTTGIPPKEQAARDSHHKVASMLQEVAVLAAQFGGEALAVRLLQRAVEVHLSALEACGVLVPYFVGDNEHRSKPGGYDAEAAATTEDVMGARVTFQAVMDDARPLPARLWLQVPVGAVEPAASGRGGSNGGGGGNGNLPVFGRLDVVGTCVGDLGLVLACARRLRQEEKVDESIQLAEKVYPVLKEILGADHAFTKSALAAFVGQGIVDQCWSQADVEGSSGGGDRGHRSLPTPTSGGARAQEVIESLSGPPSPLPKGFYAPYPSSARGANSGEGGGHGGSDGGGGRSSDELSNNGSMSSGTDGHEGEDSDNGGGRTLGGRRRAGPVGVGAYGRLPFSRRALNAGRNGHRWGHGEATAGRGAPEAASSRMQQEIYFRHRTRRARAHAFLVTAATRARFKNENRAEAGLFLRDLGRLAGATSGGNRGGGGGSGRQGVEGFAASPDGTPQMARLQRRS